MSTDFIVRNQIKRAPYPRDSPDSAPLDCFVFSYVNEKWMGDHADSDSELHVRIEEILREIERHPLNMVFDERMQQVQRCIDLDGEYVRRAKEI
jgi:hypothetical protein